MFSVTSLGHQGWLIGSDRVHIAIDPVLGPRFRRLPLTDASVFPPRRIDFDKFPPLAAVLVSHEHPDHLDFATLQRIDRAVPVYLSAHASEASRRVIRGLGFAVHDLAPGVGVRIGDLDVFTLPPYVIGEPGENEVDMVPILVRNEHGNFFTSVDIVQTVEMAREVRKHIDRPGIWTYANNAIDQATFLEWMKRPDDPIEEEVRRVVRIYVSLFDGWGHPEVTLVNGDGATLGRDLERMNPFVFTVESERLAEAFAERLPGHVFRAVHAGSTVVMRDGEIVATHDEQPFLGVTAREGWPRRGGSPLPEGLAEDFAPATGRRALTDDEQRSLESALGEFGRFLFTRPTYRGLYKLMEERDYARALAPTCALVLRDERGPQVWAFVPQTSAFVRDDIADPRSRFVCGGEFWASDVHDALCMRALADDLFHFGRKRLWNHAPDVFRCDLDTEFLLFAHPLREGVRIEPLLRACTDSEATVAVRAAQGVERIDRYGGMQPSSRSPRVRPVPADLATGSVRSEPSRTKAARAPVEDGVVAPVRVAIERVAPTWTLVGVERVAEGLRLELREEAVAIRIEATRWDPSRRHYRRVGETAFSYSPSTVEGPMLRALDRVIDALAPVIASSPTTETAR